ncbi:hypothetical protein WCLP8_1780008 [uncultured Gammaproteobacteria bacterium]
MDYLVRRSKIDCGIGVYPGWGSVHNIPSLSRVRWILVTELAIAGGERGSCDFFVHKMV